MIRVKNRPGSIRDQDSLSQMADNIKLKIFQGFTAGYTFRFDLVCYSRRLLRLFLSLTAA